jgi:zinc protease
MMTSAVVRGVVAGAVLWASPALAQVTDSSATSYEVNGLKVIHVRKPPQSHVIAVQLYLLGGSRQLTPANAGIESFMLRASEYGTRNYPGDKARRALAQTGSGIAVSAEPDWTTFALFGVKEEFDSSWAVFADRLLNPTLDSTALEIVRRRLLARAARRNASPEGHVDALADSLAFSGHPYSLPPDGNKASLSALTANDMRAYARDHLVTSRMLLVVAGDLPREQIERVVSTTIGRLPKGSYVWTLPQQWTSTKPAIIAADRSIQTNYILGYISGPPRSSPQYAAFERAMRMLSGWIGWAVREENSLSYSAYVRLMDRGAPGAAIYMSTTRPDTAMKVVNRVLEFFEREASMPRSALRKAARDFDLEYIHGTSTVAGHAEMLARAQLYDGDYHAAATLRQRMESLRFTDLRKMVKDHAKNIQYAFVGDTTQLPRKEFLKR